MLSHWALELALPLAVLGGLMALLALIPGLWRVRDRAVRCRRCGYDISGIPNTHRCSECGNTFDAGGVQTCRRRETRRLLYRLTLFALGTIVLAGAVERGGMLPARREAIVWVRFEGPSSGMSSGLTVRCRLIAWQLERTTLSYNLPLDPHVVVYVSDDDLTMHELRVTIDPRADRAEATNGTKLAVWCWLSDMGYDVTSAAAQDDLGVFAGWLADQRLWTGAIGNDVRERFTFFSMWGTLAPQETTALVRRWFAFGAVALELAGLFGLARTHGGIGALEV